jgi:PPOX class probable F420-dependent enzyme
MSLTGVMIEIPADRAHLLEKPFFAYLGTIRPDKTVQVNRMWFKRVGEQIHFTHTTKRAKYRNLQHNPSMSLLIVDPDDPFSWIELRGSLAEVVPDPTGDFYVTLGKRYGNEHQEPPADSPDRVVLAMSIESYAR